MYRNNLLRSHRHGLTLLELVVVMTILIALAGILVAMFPGMLRYAHTSTGATNMPELNKIFHMHHQTRRGWPNYLDNLVAGSSLYARLPGYEEGHGYYLASHPLSEDEAHALRNAGLTHVFNLTGDHVSDATFDCYGPAYPAAPPLSEAVPIEAGVTVARLVNDHDIEKFKGDLDHVYIVFGVGQATPLVGPGGMMQDAPIHFDDAAGTRPNEVYSRFAAVFDLGDDHGHDDGEEHDHGHHHGHGSAKFVTCVGLHRSGIAVPWMPLRGFHDDDHSH